MQATLTPLENVPSEENSTRRAARVRFKRFAWSVLAYNVLVVLWGAFVRASYSGDGCGDHWPLCNGEVIPTAPAVKTLIEFSHRVTSGLALILVVILAWRARRLFAALHPARRAARWALLFTITEALIGAGLVVFGLVADDDSVARALSLSIHLVNTFLLLGVLTLAAWYASDAEAAGELMSLRGRGAAAWVFALTLCGMLLLGVSGAVAALGDTLFPVSSLAEAWRQDAGGEAVHLLVRLRVLHPVIAAAVGAAVLWAVWITLRSASSAWARRFAWAVTIVLIAQMLAGGINVLLLAPIWMQIVHLLLADLLWILFTLLTATTFAAEKQATREAARMAEESRAAAPLGFARP